jgi:glycosyltransferase involved in cell wall biosynthesis
VIPAYNAQDGIARSIDTVLAQSFPDVEIIVVDDGSTDNTPNIVDWYASNYQNVTAIHQENAGVQAARNMGIAHARGEFTGFIDSDDMIRPDVVEKMYHSVKKNHCDIAVMSAYKIDNRGYEEFMRYPLKEDAAMPVENFLQMYASEAYALPALWNKLYRTSLVKEHPLPQIVYEDEAWTPYVLSYAETVCYLNIHGYEYDRSTCSGSLVDKWAGKSRDEVLEDHKRSIIFYLEHGNPKRKELLKKLADNELAYFGRVMAYPKYEEVRKQIAELV